MPEPGGVRSLAMRAVTRPLPAAILVITAYAFLAVLNSPGGYLGTDTGAKVITLDHMVDNGTASPAIGYWAEEWDPAGNYHPLFDSVQNDDGDWVNVTTLPMLIASKPLYSVGGYRLALALPMVGAVLAAFACRDIARRLAGDHAGWWAFWITAFGSPLAVYALDLWEHSLGAGLMLAAVALLLRLLDPGAHWALAAAAGAALGASATMRAESFVVALVAVGATCLVLLWRREIARSVVTGALAVAGFAVPWVLNAVLEVRAGGNRRSERIARESQREWWTELGDRFEEALVTSFGVPGGGFPANVLVGALTVASIVGAIVVSRRGEARQARLLYAVAAVLYLISLVSGFGFVPGAFVASPFAAAAFTSRWNRDRGFLAIIAVVMTGFIWAFQLTGGALPQWGGRYVLVPTMLFTTLGVVALVERGNDRVARRVVATFAVIVTVFGLAWLHERSHGVEEFFADLAERPEDVVISTNGFLVREAGPAYKDRLYLSVGRRGDVNGAVEVVGEAGFDTFALLTTVREPGVDADLVESDRVMFLGSPLWYHRYELRPVG